MSKFLVPLALILSGVGYYFLGPSVLGVEPNLKMIGISAVLTLVGAGKLVYDNTSSVLGLLKSRTVAVNIPDNNFVPATPTASKIFSPADYELYDYKCVKHLQKRCVEDKNTEGLEECEKIASIMFKMDAKEKK